MDTRKRESAFRIALINRNAFALIY